LNSLLLLVQGHRKELVMIEMCVPFALTAALSLGPAGPVRTAAPGVIAAAAGRAFTPPDEMGPPSKRLSQGTSPRDSLKDGARTGAIAGAAAGVVLGSLGCAVGDAMNQGWGGESRGGCVGPVVLLGAAGAGIGALIGVGVDAMFEQAPHVAAGPGGRRKGVRLRWRF
jgi:hypothetical protein